MIEAIIEFNYQNFEFLEIDLDHVNKNGRSNFSVKEVKDIVKALINGLRLMPSDVKSYGDEICSYFVRTGDYGDNSFKLVFCICSDRPTTIGVITLHRI